ncbi:MAG: hypothetical protein R6W67_02385 [Bacteroidales bacterium]
MKRYFLLIIACLSAVMVMPQEESGRNTPVTNDTLKTLSISFGSISFFRNHEYFNQITEGYTLSGSHLKPLLIWAPANNIRVSGGMFVSLWSGYEGSPVIKPVFSVSLDIDNRTRLTVGSLEGPDRHRMFDPHYAKEKIYTSFLEEGVQILFNNGNLFSDTWVDWERHIFWGDRIREEFTVGESFIYRTGSAGDPVRAEFPFQMLVKHWGGQISNYTSPVETHVNLAGGTRISLNSGDNGDGGSGIVVTGFFYHSMRELPDIPFRSGQALLLAGDHTWRDLFISAGLWMSENFYSPNGNMMYSSLSDYREGFTLSKRVLLTGSVNFNRSWHTGLLNLFLGFDWYYDLKENTFDHSLTLHLRIPEKAYGLSRRNQ